MPIGVVIGPFSATLFCLTDASVSSGSGVPASSITSTPAWRTSQLELDAGRLEHAAGRLGQLGPGSVAGNQGHAVRHRGRRVHRARPLPTRKGGSTTEKRRSRPQAFFVVAPTLSVAAAKVGHHGSFHGFSSGG